MIDRLLNLYGCLCNFVPEHNLQNLGKHLQNIYWQNIAPKIRGKHD